MPTLTPSATDALHRRLQSVALLTDSSNGLLLLPHEVRQALEDPTTLLNARHASGAQPGALNLDAGRLKESGRRVYLWLEGDTVTLRDAPPGTSRADYWAEFSLESLQRWLSDADTLLAQDVERRLGTLSLEIQTQDQGLLRGDGGRTWVQEHLPRYDRLPEALLHPASMWRRRPFQDGGHFILVAPLDDYLFVTVADTLSDLAPHATSMRALGLL